jgi:CubicO group peptidase (beta-lactamase class C family)
LTTAQALHYFALQSGGGTVSGIWKRTETWLALLILAAGVLLALIMGLPTYMKYTATPLHPEPHRAPSAVASVPSPPWTEAVARGRDLMRAHLSAQNLPGLSVAVGVGGDIVWAEGFGWADIEKRVPVTPDTRFRIGTASKVLTSAAVGLLLEKGRLKLDEEIRAHVPESPKQQWSVTLRQAMAHTGGVRNDGGDEGPLFSEHCERPADAFQFLGDRPLLFEPGTDYRYSNYAWILVSAAVEAGADQPFYAFMREQVFLPLGMHATMPDSAPSESVTSEAARKDISHRATFYFPRFAADPRYGLHLMRPLDLSCYAGAMAFLSTPSDLVRFGMAINRGKLLQPATVQLLQTPQRLTSGKETGYGLGWDLETVTLAGKSTQVVGHDGESLGGPVVSLITLPDHGIVVAVMSNISYADTFSLAVKVAEAFAEAAGSPLRR